MPIEHMKHGATLITGDAIDYFRLCTLKQAVYLETKGIRVRRGPVIWKQVAREFGITGNRAAVLAWLTTRVAELAPQQEHVVEEGGRRKREVAGIEVV
jgi:hypothetical protein